MSVISLSRRAQRGDSGAVAVIVAICALVLFGISAMAVDLGNSWSRKRSAQNDADFAALAGAAKLPATTPAQLLLARTAAWNYLADNLPRDDNGAGINPLSDYADGNTDNGEITFPDSTTITVITQRVHVSFGLAGAVGVKGNNPQAQATAAVRSPKKVLPFFIPVNCGNGSYVIKSGNNGLGYNWEEPTDQGNGAVSAGSTVTPTHVTQYLPTTGVKISGANLAGALTLVMLIGPTGEQVPAVAVVAPDLTKPNDLTFTIPPLDTTGTWYVQVRAPSTNWSSDNTNKAPSFIVDPGTPTACNQSSTGDFGLLDSPRVGINGSAIDLNLSLGLDHGLACFPGDPAQMPPSSCVSPATTYPLPSPDQANNCTASTGNGPIPGGIKDNDPTIDTANCPQIYTGNQMAAVTQGLIKGGNNSGTSFVGRLTTDTNSGCPPPTGGSNPRVVQIGSTNYTINNDTPDCYFLPNVTSLSQALNASAPIFSSDIYNSPRFFFVPVLYHNYKPQNGWYPIVDFRGAFITDEGVATPATNENGVVASGGNDIAAVKVFVFPLSALPDAANTGGTVPYLGAGPKVPVLID